MQSKQSSSQMNVMTNYQQVVQQVISSQHSQGPSKLVAKPEHGSPKKHEGSKSKKGQQKTRNKTQVA